MLTILRVLWTFCFSQDAIRNLPFHDPSEEIRTFFSAIEKSLLILYVRAPKGIIPATFGHLDALTTRSMSKTLVMSTIY